VVNRTLDLFYAHPFGLASHFMDSMASPLETPSQWLARQTMRTYSTHSQWHQPRTLEPRHIKLLHPAMDGSKNHTKSEKKSAPSWNFSSIQIMSLYIFLYRNLLHLHSSKQGAQDCSVKMAGCFGKGDFFEIFTSILIICFLFWRLFVQSWHALAGWEAGKSEAFCAAKRTLALESLSLG
jgi:hypothetical protein